MEIGSMMLLLLLSCILFLLLSSCATLDTISTNQAIKDGDTIVSHDQMFELGFFSPGRSKNRYVGIWYKKISTDTVVWVANRETPITDESGIFELSQQGNLLIRNGNRTVIWSSNSTVSMMSNNPVFVVQLLDNGNLVVWDRSNITKRVIWESFDYPGNTLLPGMKFGKDLATGREWVMRPWKSADDPSPGPYLHWLDTNGYPQLLVSQGLVLRLRYGLWNGRRFQGLQMENPNPIYSVQFVFNEKEIYFKFELKTSFVQRIVVLPDDITVHFRWMDQIQDWTVHTIGPATDTCDGYGPCGSHGSCNANSTSKSGMGKALSEGDLSPHDLLDQLHASANNAMSDDSWSTESAKGTTNSDDEKELYQSMLRYSDQVEGVKGFALSEDVYPRLIGGDSKQMGSMPTQWKDVEVNENTGGSSSLVTSDSAKKRKKEDRFEKRMAALARWKWDEVQDLVSDEEDRSPQETTPLPDSPPVALGHGKVARVGIHTRNRVKGFRMF